MKKNYKIFTYLLILVFLVVPKIGLSNTSTGDGVNIDMTILGCNNNGTCESSLGEDNLSCPNDCSAPLDDPTTGPSGGMITPPTQLDITDIKKFYQYENDKVVITWETTVPATSVVYWGEDIDYHIASLVGVGMRTEHYTVIDMTGFAYGDYNFLIKATDKNGKIKFSDVGTFNFRESESTIVPNNPTNFRTFYTTTGIGLAWNNPLNKGFSRVRLVRETRGYPQSHLNGKVVYEGQGQNIIDANIVSDQNYFYSLFAIYQDGQVSSGAVLKARYSSEEEKIITKEIIFPEPDTGADTDPDQDPDYPDTEFEPKTQQIPLEYFIFSQNGEIIEAANSIFTIDGDKAFQVLISDKYVNDKHELVFYFDKNAFSSVSSGFKFRYLPEKAVYQVSVPKLDVAGEIPFIIRNYDRNGNIISKTSGLLLSFDTKQKESIIKIVDRIDFDLNPTIFIIGFIIILLLIIRIISMWKRSGKEL